jgi:hypothetical protein
MREEVRLMASEAEFYTAEGCYINELSNIDADPEASIARARVRPGVTTRWHRVVGTTERYDFFLARVRWRLATYLHRLSLQAT